MELIKGKPTKSGKITYLYYNNKGDKISLLPETAKKRGYKPVIIEKIEKEKTVEKKIEKIEVITKSPKEILQEYLFKNKNCQIIKNGMVIFTNGKDPIIYEENG